MIYRNSSPWASFLNRWKRRWSSCGWSRPGIETFLSGENAAILSPGLGPLQLQVKPEDEADARAILEDTGEPGVVSSYTGRDLEPENS